MSDPSPGYERWIAKAESDFLVIATVLGAPDVPWDAVCFHAQQGAEKYLKAFLRCHGPEPPYIHDLPALLRSCRRIDPSLAELEPDCGLLMPYAASSRYPGTGPEPDATVGRTVIAAAERVRDAIRRRLPGATP